MLRIWIAERIDGTISTAENTDLLTLHVLTLRTNLGNTLITLAALRQCARRLIFRERKIGRRKARPILKVYILPQLYLADRKVGIEGRHFRTPVAVWTDWMGGRWI